MAISPYFIFNGKNSRDYNIIVNKLPPIHSVSNEVEYLPVPGRDGYLTIDSDRREAIDKEVTFTIYPDDYIDFIKEWLRGSGKITFSNEPEVFYIARVESVREFLGVNNEKVSSLIFKCQPFAYLYNGNRAITIYSGTKLQNNGAIAKPLIKIEGNGDIDIWINNNKFTVLNVSGEALIDSDLRMVTKEGIELYSKGPFPVLEEGINTFTLGGNNTSVEVIPRWRT